MKVCRICLTKDDILYPMSSNGLQSLYHQLTGALNLADDAEETLPQWVCEECGLRLMSYNKLRQKSLKSHQSLCQLLERVTFINKEGLNQLDKTKNDLQSNEGNADNSGTLQDDPLAILDPSEFDVENIIEEHLTEVEGTTNDLQSNASNSVSGNRVKDEISHNILGLGELITENITEDEINETDSMNNDLNSNLSNSLINNGIKHEDSHLDLSTPENINEIYSTRNDLKSNPGNTTINKGSLLQDSPVILDSFGEPEMKELEDSVFVIETRSDSSNKCLPETVVINTDSNLGLEKDFNLESISNIDNYSTDLTSLKTKNKEKDSDVIKQVDSMESLQRKILQVRVKKAVIKKEVGKTKVDKKKVGKTKVEKKKVDRKEVDKSKVGINKNKVLIKEVVKKGQGELTFDELIKVKELSILEQIAEFKRRKYSSNYTNALFKCHVCFKGFHGEAKLSRHKLLHSEKCGAIECIICKRRLRTHTNYNFHMESHKYVFSCKKCNFTACHRSSAFLHLKKHRGKVYECPDCEKKFADRSSYNYHRRLMHVSNFVCEYCGYSFVSTKGVEQHKRRKHSSEILKKIPTVDSPTCEKCKIWFVSPEALNTHLKLLHPKKSDVKIVRNINDYDKTTTICELCGMKVSFKRYTIHVKRRHFASTENQNYAHITPRPPAKKYICEHCGKVFPNKDHQKRHEVVHTKLKAYECDYCHWRFGLKSSLKLHIVNKHLPKKHIQPTLIYPCSICDKTFEKSYSRTRHMTTHMGQRPNYPCRICGKTFTGPGSRTRHNMTAHLKTGPSFVCDICGKSLTTKHKLKEHILHIHLKVPRPSKKSHGYRSDQI